MDRKGEAAQGILFFAFFIGMMMIGLGISLGVFGFFGQGYDSRFSEARALIGKTESCFKENDFANKGIDETKFLEICKLDRKVLEDGKHLVYIKNEIKKEEFFVGVYDFTVRCGIEKKDWEIPICEERKIGNYEILVGTSQNSWRVTE